MYYQLYEWNHALMSPARALNDAVRLYYKNPLNPLCYTELGRQIVAAGDVFERLTRRYGKPEFGLDTVEIDGQATRVHERIVWEKPFCRLIHFHRDRPEGAPKQPNLVIVAPMSGHYATLLRGTVAAMLPHCEVYITDWADARMVPLAMGGFDLDDYIDYVIDMVGWLKGDCHMMAVCQPAVPVFAAAAVLEATEKAHRPKSITLMGGPIDTRESPTEVNLYAANHDLDWFRRNVIMTVPLPHPGFLRQVYPGFLQLSGFMSMNFDRHLSAHYDYFDHLVKGDGDNADKHRDFYDEYLSVMDLTAEFFLQTVETVFHRHALPKGEMVHRRRPVDPKRITRTAIMTVEGENDDISGLGQTRAAHALTPNLPEEKHEHYMQEGVGHYGVFNGSRFRREIAPRIREFVYRWDGEATAGAKGGNGHSTVAGLVLGTGVAAAEAAGTVAEEGAETVAEAAATTAEAAFSAVAAGTEVAEEPALAAPEMEGAAPAAASEAQGATEVEAEATEAAAPGDFPVVAAQDEPAAAPVTVPEAPAGDAPATGAAEAIFSAADEPAAEAPAEVGAESADEAAADAAAGGATIAEALAAEAGATTPDDAPTEDAPQLHASGIDATADAEDAAPVPEPEVPSLVDAAASEKKAPARPAKRSFMKRGSSKPKRG